ncbi:ABC transporter substrate-binding protein [Halobacteriovorax sp.]|uniref:ABC transporter substrate-binding protein n=1 Tax=Halobacteriovorax sp. TaxID=2020862 RepID=UPI003569E6EB
MQFKQLSIFIFILTISLVSHSKNIEAKSIKMAISSAPSNLSPFYATDANSQNINRLVHITLTDFSKEMSFICRFCESYKERMEGKKHIISFDLRKDVKFWDGELVSAKDVYNSWKYFTDKEVIKSKFGFGLSRIKNVNVINKSQVELIYDEYNPDNLSDLALLKIVKIQKDKIVPNISFKDIVGAGPYKIKSESELEVVLSPIKKGSLDLIFKVVKDETTLALKLINKEIDLSLASISPRKLFWLKENVKGIDFHNVEGTNLIYMGVNHKNEFLKNLNVRKAISLLIPREQIIKYKLKGTATPASSFFSEAFTSMYIKNGFDKYNPKESERLFKESGFSKDEEGTWVKDGRKLSLIFRVSNNKNTIETVETIKDFLKKGGVDVTVSVQEWGTFYRNLKQGNFDLIIGQWVGFTGPAILRFVFHSESVPPNGANRGNFINKMFDKYIDQATVEQDEKKRNNYYKQALEISNREYSYINLWHPNIVWIGRSCIKNIDVQPNGSFLPLLEMVNDCE